MGHSILSSALDSNRGGALHNLTLEIFQQMDQNSDGRIDWKNGEVKGFVSTLFTRFGVPMPHWSDQAWRNMFQKVDAQSRLDAINMDEALHLARLAFEATLATLH